jgi:hypothetical protein
MKKTLEMKGVRNRGVYKFKNKETEGLLKKRQVPYTDSYVNISRKGQCLIVSSSKYVCTVMII